MSTRWTQEQVDAVRKMRDAAKVRKPSKMKNRRTLVDNILFASKREAERYLELKALLAAGKIRNLKLQEPFRLFVNGVKVCVYKADFTYFDRHDKKWVIEDAKGKRTDLYQLKKKLLLACHGIEIREV